MIFLKFIIHILKENFFSFFIFISSIRFIFHVYIYIYFILVQPKEKVSRFFRIHFDILYAVQHTFMLLLMQR